MTTGRLGVVIACILATTVALTAPARRAHAYVRYLTSADNPIAWGSTRVDIAGYPQGVPGVTADDVSGAFMRAVATWTNANPDLGACSFLDLHYTTQLPSAVVPAAGYDRTNNIVVRAGTWCSVGPAGAPDCYDPASLAITSVFVRACGEMIDADIEVNAVHFAWANLDATAASTGKQDLQNALTHELGHFIGLDHTCDLGAGQPQARDHNGAPVPPCASATDAVRQTTMFPSAPPDDVSRRTLAPDDIAGVCAVYPVGATPKQCPPTTDADADADAEDGGSTDGPGGAIGSGGSSGSGGGGGPGGGSGGTGITSDGGTTPKPNQGCGCRLPGPRQARAPVSCLLALVFLSWARFRRRSIRDRGGRR